MQGVREGETRKTLISNFLKTFRYKSIHVYMVTIKSLQNTKNTQIILSFIFDTDRFVNFNIRLNLKI